MYGAINSIAINGEDSQGLNFAVSSLQPVQFGATAFLEDFPDAVATSLQPVWFGAAAFLEDFPDVYATSLQPVNFGAPSFDAVFTAISLPAPVFGAPEFVPS